MCWEGYVEAIQKEDKKKKVVSLHNKENMAKRGGRGRKRAWQQQAATIDTDIPLHPRPLPKKQKILPQEGIVDKVEVSLMGDTNALPPPLEFDIPGELHDETNNAAVSFADQLYTEQLLRKVWRNLAQHQSWKPSPIQQHLWSLLLHTRYHTIGVASTGSGKTLAYALPTLVSTEAAILVLVPTRELVQQVAKIFVKAVKAFQKQQPQKTADLLVVPIHGGVSRERQREELEDAATAGRAVIVATPGRLLDLCKTASLLPVFSYIVLDEADQLSKDGDLGPQVHEILKMTCDVDGTRLVLVSATYPERARAKFQSWVGDTYALVQVDHVHQTTTATPSTKEGSMVVDIETVVHSGDQLNGEAIGETSVSAHSSRDNSGIFARIPSHLQQVLHVCSEHKKPRKLLHTLNQIYDQFPNQRNRPLGIIFVSKIEKIKHITKLLEKEGIASVELHSQLQSTHQRTTNLAQFACGQKPLLLATDLAARGIDIPSVHFVIQYDFPGNLEQYVHRCGRAGRTYNMANDNGNNPKPTVYSFFTRNLRAMAPDLVQLLESNQAWVDPNLRALANETANGQTGQTRRKNGQKKDTAAEKADVENQSIDPEEESDHIDDFPDLSATRIVLKRASHVSDASSSEEDDDE
jgi:ATP-dependent RNA helicase DDX5/DBP2